MVHTIIGGAGQFCYLVWEVWDPALPALPWCLMNPSTQKGREVGTDAVWWRTRYFTEAFGFGGQVLSYLYAYPTANQTALRAAGYPVGPENDRYILEAARRGAGTVMCAWGSAASLKRQKAVLALIREAGYSPHALGMGTKGRPLPPLAAPPSAQAIAL